MLNSESKLIWSANFNILFCQNIGYVDSSNNRVRLIRDRSSGVLHVSIVTLSARNCRFVNICEANFRIANANALNQPGFGDQRNLFECRPLRRSDVPGRTRLAVTRRMKRLDCAVNASHHGVSNCVPVISSRYVPF